MASIYEQNSIFLGYSSKIIQADSKEENSTDSVISKKAIEGAKSMGVMIIPEAQSLLTKQLLVKPILPSASIKPIKTAQCFEIFEVRVSYNGSRKTSGKIHGYIYWDGAMGERDIYRRNKSNAEIVSFPGPITLAGLAVAIRADDPLIMFVHLFHGNDEVCRGYTREWHNINGWFVCDELITHEVKGRNGAAVVTYAIITNAVVAAVEVSLVKGNRNARARIYGMITASMTGWDLKRMLFCKKRDKFTNVECGASIPLLRSVLIVPHTSSLHIHVDLSDAFSYPNVPVAKGTVHFTDKFRGDFEETISGKYGAIKVKVTWWSYFDHPDTYKVRSRYGV